MAGASDGRCVKCCEYNLIAAFHNFYMTHGSCVFCLTADFAVQQAKKLNVHGCDLKLSYGKSYCTHTMEAKGNGCSGWQADGRNVWRIGRREQKFSQFKRLQCSTCLEGRYSRFYIIGLAFGL